MACRSMMLLAWYPRFLLIRTLTVEMAILCRGVLDAAMVSDALLKFVMVSAAQGCSRMTSVHSA